MLQDMTKQKKSGQLNKQSVNMLDKMDKKQGANS